MPENSLVTYLNLATVPPTFFDKKAINILIFARRSLKLLQLIREKKIYIYMAGRISFRRYYERFVDRERRLGL